mgnify:CR=1 FL=1
MSRVLFIPHAPRGKYKLRSLQFALAAAGRVDTLYLDYTMPDMSSRFGAVRVAQRLLHRRRTRSLALREEAGLETELRRGDYRRLLGWLRAKVHRQGQRFPAPELIQAATGEPTPGLRVIPLDLDGDGAIRPDEDFYANKATIIDAIRRRVYPFPPARELYLVTKGEPGPTIKAFYRWILTDGQQYVDSAGYIPLTKALLDDGIAKLK